MSQTNGWDQHNLCIFHPHTLNCLGNVLCRYTTNQTIILQDIFLLKNYKAFKFQGINSNSQGKLFNFFFLHFYHDFLLIDCYQMTLILKKQKHITFLSTFQYLGLLFEEKFDTKFDYQFSGLIINMSGVISIEGNLGAGKSTLISFLNLPIIKQPVQEWEHMIGGNILKNYYENPKRWAFTFQLNALHSRNILWNKAIKQKPQILHFSQRSPQADRQIFGEIMYRQGNLDEAEYAIYSQICSKISKSSPLKAIIYLKCAPQLCIQRIKMRNRQGQAALPLQYIRKVHQRHQEWLNSLKDIPILIIDTGIFDIYSKKDQQEVIKLIENFTAKVNSEQNRKISVETIPEFELQQKISVKI